MAENPLQPNSLQPNSLPPNRLPPRPLKDKPQYKRVAQSVVICGGGTRCVSFIGGLLYLRDLGALEGVKRWYCCSAGCAVAVVFALKLSNEKILKTFYDFDFTKSRDFTAESMFDITETYGLDNGIGLRKSFALFLEDICKTSSTWTLKEFKEKMGCDIHFFISNVSKSMPFFASAESHPDLFLLDAIYSTMALPIYYRPYKHLPTGDYWCDGILGQNFPWNFISEKEKQNAIGLFFPQQELEKKPSFFLYLNFVISFRNNHEQTLIFDKWFTNCISIPVSDFPSLLLELTVEDRKYLMDVCRHEVEKWWSVVGKDVFIAFSPVGTKETLPASAVPHTLLHSPLHLERQPSDTQRLLRDLYRDSHQSQDLLPPSEPRVRRWSV